tara:strand:- start:1090 stop:1677 length:588 start_codon:yes stop_codon:yes gene_type:complete
MHDFLNNYFLNIENISKKLEYNIIEKLVDEILYVRKNNGRIFFLGVGGSAANASHAVNDFRKLCNIESYAPTDNVSELTARINDDGWDKSISTWLKVSNLNKNDAIMIFSVGGGDLERKVSVNLIEAIRYSKKVNSKVFGIVGPNGGYTKMYGDCVIILPIDDKNLLTPLAESYQAIVWHSIVSHPKLKINQTKW